MASCKQVRIPSAAICFISLCSGYKERSKSDWWERRISLKNFLSMQAISCNLTQFKQNNAENKWENHSPHPKITANLIGILKCFVQMLIFL